jgi:ABC-type oligopeptide transport system substrate-binding subunit
MKQFSKLVLLGVIVAALIAMVLPVGAQETEPGEGGTIIRSNIGDDPSSFSPILGSSTTESYVTSKMYPDNWTG